LHLQAWESGIRVTGTPISKFYTSFRKVKEQEKMKDIVQVKTFLIIVETRHKKFSFSFLNKIVKTNIINLLKKLKYFLILVSEC
jgi:serine kinase of HPr protein (carbohydrate metabolism regulator)